MSGPTTDLRVYRLQVFNFLQSMTVKFTPLCNLINAMVLRNGYDVDEDNPQTWKYYLNMTGQYHPSDTVMTVVSLDTQETIDFTVANLENNGRTKAAYQPGTSYYTQLCERYPAQTDLIKSIVFPAGDIDACIDADEFSIMAYGDGYLESTESGYILTQLEEAINYIYVRRYPSWLSYEPYFNVTFLAQFWHRMVEAVFTARFNAIKTVNVHSWHIWQYLGSHGIGDFSDILSRELSLFLYRNERYLYWNRGKGSTLSILDANLLKPISVGVYGRDVYQQTIDGASDYQLIPELVAVAVSGRESSTGESVPAESISDMNARLVEVGDEIDATAEHVQSVERTLSSTILNSYPTKILELRPLPRDRKYADFFNVFLMDTLVTMIAQGQYDPIISIYSEAANAYVTLSGKDALVLLYYCMMRVSYQTPIDLPTWYTSRTAYYPTPKTPPQTFATLGASLLLTNYVDVDGWSSDVNYPKQISDPNTFSDQLSNHFLKALYRVIESRMTDDLTTLKAMETLVPYIFNQTQMTIDLGEGVNTYSEWFGRHTDVYKQYILNYESAADPQADYDDLATRIFTALVPVTDIMSQYGNFSLSDQSYTRLKELFISLCSYNVTFLDTTRDVYQFFFIEDMAIASTAKSWSDNKAYALYDRVTISSTMSGMIDMDVSDIELSMASTFSGLLEYDYAIPMDITTSYSKQAPVDVSIVAVPTTVSMSTAIPYPDDFPIAVGSV